MSPEKETSFLLHPSYSLAVEGLIKEHNSGKNRKPVFESGLIVKGANEERRNHSQESAQILNSNNACTVLHDIVFRFHALSLIGSKKKSC